MNKIVLVGNLVRNPSLETIANGTAVCNFTLAVNRRILNAGGERETDFFRIIAWRALAESCKKYLEKGSKVAVFGNLQNRSYEDKNGNKKTSVEIVAEDVEFLSYKEHSYSTEKTRQKIDELEPVDDDNLPF